MNQLPGRPPQSEGQVLEAKHRLADAKLRLDLARNYLREVRDDLKCSVPPSDGNYAFRRALRLENLALLRYREALKVFADLVLRGKRNSEE